MGVHVSPHSEHPPTSLPTPSLWVVPEHGLWMPCFMCGTCTGHLGVWSCTCFTAILSHRPTLTFSHVVQKSVLYICVSFVALHIGSLLLSFWIPYVCVNTLYWCFSFWRHCFKTWLISNGGKKQGRKNKTVCSCPGVGIPKEERNVSLDS